MYTCKLFCDLKIVVVSVFLYDCLKNIVSNQLMQ